MAEPSIFTRIINGEIPAHKIFEDDKVISFLDINPIAPGHALVIPKEQVESLWDLDNKLYQYVMEVVKKVARRQQDILSPARVGFFLDGIGIPHAHVHVIPLNDGLETTIVAHNNKKDQQEPDHTALATLAEQLRFS
jgi:histidine triad (HIT) family protein